MTRAAQSSEQCQSRDREQVLRRHQEMLQPVVKRPEPAIHQMRMGGRGGHREARKQQPRVSHHPHPAHVRAFHKNTAPAIVTPAPPRRSVIWPSFQRWMRPIATPVR